MIARLVSILVLTVFILNHSVYGQFKFVEVNSRKLPKEFKYKGKIVNSIKWTDSLGVNYMLVTKKDTAVNVNHDRKNVTVCFYHYISNNGGYRMIWSYLSSNEGDGIEFVNTDTVFNITDLDSNGTAEVWYMYRLRYKEIFPDLIKVTMNEGNEKFQIRSKDYINDVQINEKYIFDYNFKDRAGKAIFRSFAINLWNKYSGN